MTRWRQKTTYVVAHRFYEGGTAPVQLWDGLVYLGKHRADRAAHPVRLIRVTRKQGKQRQVYHYLTNVLDPRELPAWQVVALYQRRWEIEGAFNLLKTHLGLHLLWSSHASVLLHQIYATFIVCQVILALRHEVATRGEADLREVSLELLIRSLPRLAVDFEDPLGECGRAGWKAGYLRAFRGKTCEVPRVPEEAYRFRDPPPEPRRPRYGSRAYNERTDRRSPQKAARRARYWPGAEDRQL